MKALEQYRLNRVQTYLWLFIVISPTAVAQNFNEKINKELFFEKKGEHNTLIIANLNGNVSVSAYEGDKILVDISKSIQGKTPERLEAGKKEIQPGFIDLADTIVIYTISPCHRFEKSSNKNQNWQRDVNWGYAWCQNSNDQCHESYTYTVDFTVKVPASCNLVLSTINNGNVVVKDVAGVVKTNNINGSIQLSNLSREAEAHTINGDVDIDYGHNPTKACRFYSLNGDINALFQKGLAANVSFESFQGDFYSNIERIEKLPADVVTNEGAQGVRFKVNNNRYRVGAGGALLDFETFNGNLYLKEKNN